MTSTATQLNCSTGDFITTAVSGLAALRTAARRSTAALPVQRRPVIHPTSAGRKDRRAGKVIASAGLALLLGAVFQLAGVPVAGAGTLYFIFTDDGKTSTISASGSLDLSLQPSPGTSKLPEKLIEIVDLTAPHRYTSVSPTSKIEPMYQDYSTVISVEGEDSFTGNTAVNDPPDYESSLYVEIGPQSFFRIDGSRVKDGVYTPGDAKATFTGTLLDVLGDDDFRIEYTFENNRIIFETRPLPEMERRSLKHTLASVAQATLTGAVDTISHRFDAGPGVQELTLAGQPVGGGHGAPEAALATNSHQAVFGSDPRAGGRSARQGVETWDGDLRIRAQEVDAGALLSNSGFTLPMAGTDAGAGGSGWTLWGRGDWLGFEGVNGTSSWDGKQWTAWFGADTRMSERVMAGLAVSRGAVEMDYKPDGRFDGKLETSLTTVWPYLQMTTGNGGAVRFVIGAGSGDAEHRGHGEEDFEEAGLSLVAGSVSGRFPMTRMGGASISAIGGASMAQIKTNGEASTSSIKGLQANSWRVRAGVEAAHDGYPMSSESGWTMAPRGSVAARQDGGDGENGTGLEVSAGVRLSAPGGRFSLDASGHLLALHSEDNTKEWGASLEARMNSKADGRGLSLALGTGWGHQHQDGALARERLFDEGRQVEPQGLSLTARSGYGFAMSGGLLTPYAEMAYEGDEARTRNFETGISFARGEFGASMTAGLRDSDDSDSETRIGLELELRY